MAYIIALLLNFVLPNPSSPLDCPFPLIHQQSPHSSAEDSWSTSMMTNLFDSPTPGTSSPMPSSSTSDAFQLPLDSESIQELTITHSNTHDGWVVSHIPPFDGTEVLSDYEYCLFPDEDSIVTYLSIRRRLTNLLRTRSSKFQQVPDGCCHSTHNLTKDGAYPQETRDREGWHTFFEVNRRCPLHGKPDHIAHLHRMLQQTTEQIITCESDPANSCNPDEAPFKDLWERFSGLHMAIGRVISQETVIDATGHTRSLTTVKDVPLNRKVFFMSTILEPFVYYVHWRMRQEKNKSWVGPHKGDTSCLHENCLEDGKWMEWISPAEIDSIPPVTSLICKAHIKTISKCIMTESMGLLQEENLPVYLLTETVQKSIPNRYVRSLISGILSSYQVQNRTSAPWRRHRSEHILIAGGKQSSGPAVSMKDQKIRVVRCWCKGEGQADCGK